MNLSDLLEDGNKDLVIIYPGRFHPFHIGHGKVYQYLKQNYSNAKVFISTSGKVDGDRSPFTFEEKRKMMILAGVDSGAIVQTKSPYQSIEIMERFDKDKTVVVFAVSEKDMAEDPRFDFSNGLKLKKNGEPAYLQKWNSLDDAETFGTRGYIATTPTFKFKVLGQEINSASQIRNMIAKSDDTKLTQMLQDLYSVTDVPQDIIDLFKNKVGNKETMNENWDEHSFSKFLKENVIEDNIMKKGILTTITEGKSPHKKGTKKYNAHMAAMHAESIDEEFDRKVKEVVESKTSIAADIKDYVDDHKEHFDAYPMDVEVDDKVYDWDEYWGILDKVYPDAYDNQYATESVLAHGGKGQYKAVTDGGVVRIMHKGKEIASGDFDSGADGWFVSRDSDKGQKFFSNAQDMVDHFAENIHAKTNEEKEELKEFWPAVAYAASRIPASTYASAGTAIAGTASKAGKWIKSKLKKEGKVDEWVQDQDAGNWSMWTAQERSFIQELCLRHDGVERDPAGLKYLGKSELWDEGSILKDKGKLTTLMLWVKKNKDDIEGRFTRMFKVYSKGNNNEQSDGNQVLQNIIGKIGSVEESVNEGDYANEQHEQLEYIHHVLQECGDGNVDNAMIDQAIAFVEDIREQHFNADGSTKSESIKEGLDNDDTRDIAIRCIDEMVAQGLIANDMDTDGDTEFQIQDIIHDQINKALQVRESQGHQDLGNIAGYLDTIDEYVEMLFRKEAGHAQPDSTSIKEIAYRIQNAVDDIRTRELELKPSLIRAKYNEEIKEMFSKDASKRDRQNARAKEKEDRALTSKEREKRSWAMVASKDHSDKETVNEDHNISIDLLRKVARQMEDDAHKGDYTAIEELLQNVSEEELKAFLSDHRSSNEWDESVEEGVMGTIGQGIDNAVVGVGKLIKKGVKAASPHVKKAAVSGAKKMSKIGSKNTSYDMKTGKTNTTYGMANATEAYNEDDSSDLKKMQDAYKYNEDRNNHSENILMLAQAFGDRGEIKAVEGLLKVIKRQGYVTPDQSEMMYKAIHKKYYSQLFPTENEGNEFSGELAKAKIDGKKEFKVDGKTYKVKEALTKLIDKQKFVEAGIVNYSDAKGTPEYKEGQKAAKNGEPYDSNPYSGAEKLKWSKGHNEWRHANKRKKGEPNFGARGQFE